MFWEGSLTHGRGGLEETDVDNDYDVIVVGGGSSMANVLSFGRIAGRNAARVGQTNFA